MISRREFLGAGIALWASQGMAKVSGDPRLLDVRYWPSPEYSRIVLEWDRPVASSMQMLENPDRLVVDLPLPRYQDIAERWSSLDVGKDLWIQKLRGGQFNSDTTRLVMDLKSAVQSRSLMLPPLEGGGHRMVLDLFPLDPPEDEPEPVLTTAPSKKQENWKRNFVVVLDPGHGGEDPGAIGPTRLQEKVVNLAIARKLREQIQGPGWTVHLTRDGDYFIPLAERVRKARRWKADLFISIHADAWIKPDVRGSSVFVLNERGASSAAARWLAEQENKADEIGGLAFKTRDPHLRRTLMDLANTYTQDGSRSIAQLTLKALGRLHPLHKPDVEEAGFAVLKAPDIPSILVETAFISNPEEEKRLRSPEHQQKIALEMANAIRAYRSRFA